MESIYDAVLLDTYTSTCAVKVKSTKRPCISPSACRWMASAMYWVCGSAKTRAPSSGSAYSTVIRAGAWTTSYCVFGRPYRVYERHRSCISQNGDTTVHHPPNQEHTKYVSYKDIKDLMADLKKVYAAVDEQTALFSWTPLKRSWAGNIPKSQPPRATTGKFIDQFQIP